MKKPLFAVLACCFLLICSNVYANEQLGRGLFITVFDNPPLLSSRDEIEKLIGFAKQKGIQTLYVQVYRANQSWFPSKVGDDTPYYACVKNVGEDPLALLIKEAHKEGLEVHAWINLLSLAKNSDAPILKKYGTSVLTRNLEKKSAISDYQIDNQYFLEPGDLRVRRELARLVGELVSRYRDLDGVQLDYIRYPDKNPAYGYTEANMSRFKKATGLKTMDESTPVWRSWKRNQVTELVRELAAKARSLNPNLHVSTTGCVSYLRAREEAFQDWPLWVNEGMVEFVTLMSYPDNVLKFKAYVDEARAKVNNFKSMNIAIGAYVLGKSPDVFAGQLAVCEEAGGRECVMFHYGSLNEHQELSKQLDNLSVSTK